ncbi:hypothetical protein [Mesorhizobium sp. GR13]|uniref:hypothetical protein n=1 Tax=Mesorhizobium sp. GR13 TaxID=2562308 RepID=UPI0010BFFE11|nr:hypothetical protein [Mesorhizobium sp. GR13]
MTVAITPITQSSSVKCSTIAMIAGPLTNLVLSAWGADQIHHYLVAPDHLRHLWNAWLSQRAQVDHSASDYLKTTRSKEIVADAFGSCPPGYLNALAKLGAVAKRAELYRDLYIVLSRGGKLARLIQHSKQIDDDAIIALSRLPDDPHSVEVAENLIRRKSEAGAIRELIWIVTTLRYRFPQLDIDDLILNSGNPIAEIQKIVIGLPFPDPPWTATGNLKPVTSAKDLTAIAKEFDNCLAEPEKALEASLAVQSGRRYHYVWEGTQRVLLSFSRFGDLGWIVREAGTRCDAFMTSTTKSDIQSVLAMIPQVCPANGGYNCRPITVFAVD